MCCLPATAIPLVPAVGFSAGVFFIKALNHIQDVSVCSSNEITQTTHPQFGFRRASAARPKSLAEPEQCSPLLLQLSTQQCRESSPFMCGHGLESTGDGITLGLGAGADSSLGCLAKAAAAASRRSCRKAGRARAGASPEF